MTVTGNQTAEKIVAIPWDEGLVGQARQIASSSKTPLCVVAGPGTGKTFTMMRRITRLIVEDRIDPSRILACTFTRTAAEDLARAISKLGVDGAKKIRAQTIHSLCFSMLSKEEVLAVTGRVPRPLLQYEERFLLEDLKAEGRGGIRECGKRLLAFSAAWSRLQHEEPGWPTDETDKKFHDALIAWLFYHQAMLIGELIPESIRYLRHNPHSSYRSLAYDHVLVDEYQDLNRAEQAFIDLISSSSLVVVGDEDQSIYSFKHAHPQGIVEFPTTHLGTATLGLDECHRCPKLVVELANSLISYNSTRSPRKLRIAEPNPEGEVFVVQWQGMTEEARGIADFIRSRIDSRLVSPGGILVLAPRREFGYRIRDELRFLNVAAHSFFSEELLEGDPKHLSSSKAQQALTLLALLGNPNDIVALRCWCGYGSSSLNSQAWGRLRSHCETSGESPWLALERMESGDLRLQYTKPVLDRFIQLKAILTSLQDLNGSNLRQSVLPETEDWAAPFIAICNGIESEEYTAPEILEVIRRNVTQPETPTDVDYVRVMTLHKSKGLTAEMVVVVGCNEGLLPFIDFAAPVSGQQRSLEEQRRLFYVAITRAKRTLVLSSVTGVLSRDAHHMNLKTGRQVGSRRMVPASRFLSELGPRCPRAVIGQELINQEDN